jgi:signal transduction histidine kinase
MLFVGLLCLFCLRFAETDWRLFRRVITGFVIVVPLVLYLSNELGIVSHAAVGVRLVAIVLVLIALTAVARYAMRKRNVESLLLLLAGAVSAAFAIHDWLAAQDSTDIRPLMLVPYAGLAFLLLVGWILTDRFVRALNEFETLNTSLERRVAEKSEALEEQLEQTRAARDAAEAANHAKTRFLAAASHDLRQPLHALGLFAARLGDRTRDPDDAALVHRIETSVSSLDSLFSALLDVSKLEAGAVATESRAMALNPLFDRLANDFAPEALEKNLKLAVVPTARAVYSDPVLLERILRNLLANALRYTSEGGVVVGVRRRGSRLAVEVWDSGPGIAADKIEHVFEEFYQIGNPERAQAHGLGLGLAIVRRLARLLDHEVQVASRPGRGSVFRVLIAGVPAGMPVPPLLPPPPLEPNPLDGRRVLVVEDDEPIREGMRQTLASWNCVPMLAADEDEATARYGSEPPPDALLVDFRLPQGRDGLDAITRLRAAYGCDIPAIVVSGESSSEELARIAAAGFELLHKPLAPARLRAALSYLLRA